MQRFLLNRALAIAVVAGTFAVAQAGPGGKGNSGGQGGSNHSQPGSQSQSMSNNSRGTQVMQYKATPGGKDYATTHGTSFKHGTYYQGKSHSHWSHYCWSNTYGC